MKSKVYSLSVLTVLFLLFSCELADGDSALSVAERLEGDWRCDETASEFKAALDFYTVTIYIYSLDDDQILIENFYELGRSIDVIASVNGMNITLPNQVTEDGFTIYGSGVIDSDYNTITWTYFADDGSGIWDEVEAIYTRIE